MEALDQPVMPEEVAVDPLTIIVGTGALVVGAGAAAWRGARQSVTVAAERDALAVKAARENAAHQAELESVRATASVEAREELARAKEALLNEGDAHRKRLAEEESRLRARVSERVRVRGGVEEWGASVCGQGWVRGGDDDGVWVVWLARSPRTRCGRRR